MDFGFGTFLAFLSDGVRSLNRKVIVSQSKRTLVLVEDGVEMQATLKEYLERLGYSVQPFSEPQKAIQYFSALGEEVWKNITIITDLGLPGISGIELIKKIRSLSQIPPIILISATVTPSQREQALAQGAMVILDKPFRLERLKMLIEGC